MRYAVCEQCSCGLANNDWTWVDYYATTLEEGEEEYARLMSSVEAMGLVAMGDRINAGIIGDGTDPDNPGYFRCFVCGGDELGGYWWDSVERDPVPQYRRREEEQSDRFPYPEREDNER